MTYKGAILLCCSILCSPAFAFNLGREVGHCFHGGCDVIWGVNQRIDDGIRSKAESIATPFREAFEAAMTQLFDKKLTPFWEKVNGDLAARIDQGGDRADKIIRETQDGVLKIIADAAALAEKTAGDVAQIIQQSFAEANSLEAKINDDLRALVEDIDCKIGGTRDGLIDWLRQLVTFPHPWDSCYMSYGVLPPSSTDYVNWYRIIKCTYVRDLDNSKTVEDIKFNYARLSQLSRRTRCVAQDPVTSVQLADESHAYAINFEMWRLASR